MSPEPTGSLGMNRKGHMLGAVSFLTFLLPLLKKDTSDELSFPCSRIYLAPNTTHLFSVPESLRDKGEGVPVYSGSLCPGKKGQPGSQDIRLPVKRNPCVAHLPTGLSLPS